MTYKLALWFTWMGIASWIGGYATAQQTQPNVIPGCQFNTVAPSLANGQTAILQCDSTGRLKVTTTP